MLFKALAIAAVAALPMIARAQGTTQTHDTTAMGHTQSHMDSTTMTPKMHSSMKTHDTTAMGHNMMHKDSSSMKKMHHRRSMTAKKDSSSLSVSPVDSARMGIPSTKQMSTPPL